ncbi:YkgJ family cysteine cluster protein, partial [Pantoea sp. SIMBA_072]
MTDSLRFGCTGCGKCCTGHHVPLTLDEARRWADDAGQVVVLIEAFIADGPGMPAEQREHVMRRS